jgi:hypothetical protein
LLLILLITVLLTYIKGSKSQVVIAGAAAGLIAR